MRTVLARERGMTNSFQSIRARVLVGCAALALSAYVAACADKSQHASDGDSGAAAPATRIELSPGVRPDSTAGVATATGMPGVAGDTSGSRKGPSDSVRLRTP